MKIGESKELPIPFTNRYYSKKTKIIDEYILNPFHKDIIFKAKPVIHLLKIGILKEEIFSNVLKYAVYNDLEYSDFVENMCPRDEEVRNKLLDFDSDWSIELQKAYYIRRNQDDTAKAIYRLVSIGIIDSYTIDYQNKLYTVYFTKKEDKNYFSYLEDLISRYTSKNVAKNEIKKLKKEKNNLLNENKATVISVCLEYLTKFIYSRIKAKRLQAIDDMVKLCQTSILIENPEEQNRHIKDEIYYYFNAKYSRRGYYEKTPNGDLPASMPDDYDDNITLNNYIEKYLKLVENVETGEFISNIKHLRGSCMKMLRQHPDRPEFRVLKSFTLFILADSISGLLIEAKDELIQSIIDWKNIDSDFNPIEFSKAFINRIEKHIINYDINIEFDDIEDAFYSKYYAIWTSKFANQFLA
jgi:ATP-dependent DNA helicase RecQ